MARQAFGSPYDPCPCDSAKGAKFCCRHGKRWVKPPATITPAAPLTGERRNRCYAAASGDCGGPLTREHFVSHVLLNQIEGNGQVNASGFPWQEQHTLTLLRPARLVGKVLCERHNNAMGPLDAEIGRLSLALKAYSREFVDSAATATLKLFCGHDVERWMLKTLIGLVSSKNLKHARFDARWPDILYGRVPWPTGLRLFVEGSLGEVGFHSDSFDFGTFVRLSDFSVAVFRVLFRGVKLALVLDSSTVSAIFGMCRPGRLHFTDGRRTSTIEICWNDGGAHGSIEYTGIGTYTGAPPTWPEWRKVGPLPPTGATQAGTVPDKFRTRLDKS